MNDQDAPPDVISGPAYMPADIDVIDPGYDHAEVTGIAASLVTYEPVPLMAASLGKEAG
jgi:hypothetical protein